MTCARSGIRSGGTILPFVTQVPIPVHCTAVIILNKGLHISVISEAIPLPHLRWDASSLCTHRSFLVLISILQWLEIWNTGTKLYTFPWLMWSLLHNLCIHLQLIGSQQPIIPAQIPDGEGSRLGHWISVCRAANLKHCATGTVVFCEIHVFMALLGKHFDSLSCFISTSCP